MLSLAKFRLSFYVSVDCRMRLFLVGFGGVGKQMAAILLANLKPDSQGSADMIELAKTVTVVAITTNTRESLQCERN